MLWLLLLLREVARLDASKRGSGFLAGGTKDPRWQPSRRCFPPMLEPTLLNTTLCPGRDTCVPTRAVQRGMAHAAGALLAAGAHPAVPRFTPSLNSALHVAAMRVRLPAARVLGRGVLLSYQTVLDVKPQHRWQAWGCGLRACVDYWPATPLSPDAASMQRASLFCSVCPIPAQGDLACVRHLVAALCSLAAATPSVLDSAGVATATGPAVSAAPASGAGGAGAAPEEPPAGAPPPQTGVAPGPAGSPVDLLSGNGSTPLLLACGMGHLGAAAALIKVRDVEASRANVSET